MHIHKAELVCSVDLQNIKNCHSGLDPESFQFGL